MTCIHVPISIDRVNISPTMRSSTNCIQHRDCMERWTGVLRPTSPSGNTLAPHSHNTIARVRGLCGRKQGRNCCDWCSNPCSCTAALRGFENSGRISVFGAVVPFMIRQRQLLILSLCIPFELPRNSRIASLFGCWLASSHFRNKMMRLRWISLGL